MTQKRINRIRLIYGILLSIVIVTAGVCLISACIGIYRSGDHPFSREAVAEHFAPIAVPVYLCLVMVIAGFVLDLLLPREAKKPRSEKQDGLVLKRMRQKADLEQCSQELRGAIAAQRTKRRLCKGICGAGMLLCALIFLIYALNGSHFDLPDITGSMIRAMWVLLPCLAGCFGCAVLQVFYCRASIRQEIELLKQAPSGKCAADAPKPHQNRLLYARCAIAAVGIGLLLYGFFSGGTADVLTKAINICTECVGLG